MDDVRGLAADATGVYVHNYSHGPSPFRKYSKDGALLWQLSFLPPSYLVYAMKADSSGVYLTGASPFTFEANYDVFVSKADGNGNLEWTRQVGSPGSGGVDIGHALAMDDTGIYVVGEAQSRLPEQVEEIRDAAFLMKYDRSGNRQWIRQFKIYGRTTATGVATFGSAVYVTGRTANTGSGISYVRKYDGGGNLLWTREVGSYEHTVSRIAVDSSGIYLAGTSALFKPADLAESDVFAHKLDLNGNLVWARRFGTAGSDAVIDMALGATGIYIVGSTTGTFAGQVSAGNLDSFISKHDFHGNMLWTRQFGTAAPDAATAIALDGSTVFVGGYTEGTFPGQTSGGGRDAFILRLEDRPRSLRFVPLTPCRILDTRVNQGTTGPFGPPTLQSQETRAIPVAQSGCGIPSDAKAYVLNSTVVPSEPLAFLTLWSGDTPQPAVSTLNSFHGGVVANAAIVQAGFGGGIAVYASNRTDLILDINGYFTDADAQAMSYYTLPPCRVADTRLPQFGLLGPPVLAGNSSRSFPIIDGVCQVPNRAAAYSLNTTVVPPRALSYLTLWPTGQSRPLASTLNSFDGAVVANAAIVRAGANGAISAYGSDATELIIDVSGYFGPRGNLNELLFTPITPCRILDTRTAGLGAPQPGGQSRTYTIGGACGVPSGAKAYSLNATVVPNGPLGYLTIWPAGTAQPHVSTLNSYLGRVIANAAIVPVGLNDAISVFATDDTHLVLDINGYFH